MSAMNSTEARPWLKNYPKGVKSEIDLDRFSSLPDLIDSTCDRFGPKPAFSNLGHAISFSELQKRVEEFATFCQSELKLQKGDRIALQMPNLLQYPIALFGALKAGLVVVNVNPLYTPSEME